MNFFDNAPVVYDPNTKILCEQGTRKILDGTEPVFEGLGRFTIFFHEAYNMLKRWIRDDKPFPNTQLFNNPLLLPYFEPKKNTTEMIPGGHLQDISGEAVSKLSAAAATEFLKTRLVCGLSSLNAKTLRTLVLQHVNMAGADGFATNNWYPQFIR